MPIEVIKYQLHELCNKNAQIIIETEKGVQISLELTNEGTMLWFPYGNELEAREFGHMMVKPVKL